MQAQCHAVVGTWKQNAFKSMSVKMRGIWQREIENLLNEYKNRIEKIKWTTYGVMFFFFFKKRDQEDNILY